MINVQQIETASVTFNQYDNGVNEIIYQESSKRAFEKFIYFTNRVIKETPIDSTAYILCNLTKTHHYMLDYHYAQIKKLSLKYLPCERASLRFAGIYPQMTKEQEMILAYMQSLELPRMKLNMFAIADYRKAVAWLLGGL